MFGQSIKVTVTPQDKTPVEPDLTVLSPLLPVGWVGRAPDDVGPDVCLAAGFRPPEGKLLLNTVNGSVPLNISKAMVSKEQKTYFYAGFSDQTMLSCELNASTSNDDNVGRCADLHPGEGSQAELLPAAAELSQSGVHQDCGLQHHGHHQSHALLTQHHGRHGHHQSPALLTQHHGHHGHHQSPALLTQHHGHHGHHQSPALLTQHHSLSCSSVFIHTEELRWPLRDSLTCCLSRTINIRHCKYDPFNWLKTFHEQM
ncbi:hypothetical protein INR49_027223 [Caranx melampygus]|nr:hypothetical protein INR49_027223 [Caranx melampygus]